jgi:hypothetical protein
MPTLNPVQQQLRKLLVINPNTCNQHHCHRYASHPVCVRSKVPPDSFAY